jgi:tRNA threonylcarbamoyladenosine biosynthesis protein TsaB
MRILAIETSGPRGGIALACRGETADDSPDVALAKSGAGPHIIQEIRLAEGLRHGRDLVLAAKTACDRAGWDARALPLVAVSIGPGSFTGIRIAVTVAKFMAMETGAKIVAVPSFRCLAADAPKEKSRIVTIIDAKRGGLFASIFERNPQTPSKPPMIEAHGTAGGSPRDAGGLLDEFDEVLGPALIEPAALAARLSDPEPTSRSGQSCPPRQAYILGYGIEKGREALGGFEFAPPALWDIRPSVVARLGLELAAAGQFTDPLRLEPLYIRPPEAVELWEKKNRDVSEPRP